jgi:hypothetical protein
MAKTAWAKHLMKTFKSMKSKNKDAKLRDAMKVAGKTYKKKATKGGESAMPKLPSMGGKKRTMKRKCKSKCKRKTKSMKGGQLSFSEYDSNPSLGGNDNTENFEEDLEEDFKEPFGTTARKLTKEEIRERRERRRRRRKNRNQ